MPRIDAIPAGSPCWIDLSTSDEARSADFYGQLFGWTVVDPGPQYGGYVNFAKDGALVGGCMTNDGSDGDRDVWSVYLAVDDAAKAVEASVTNGGEVLVDAMPVVDLGHMAVVADAGGAHVGIWQPGAHTGFGVLAEIGAPAWFELHTRDYERSIRFYEDVFGWHTAVAADEPGFRYTTLGEGETASAGVMDASAILPAGMPPHWSVYFAVDDADAACERVVALGGSVVRPPEPSPYGTLAEVADPTGARFKLQSAG